MNANFKKSLNIFNTEKILRALPGIRRGFEKECLRVNKNLNIAMSAHPKGLGSNLTHPLITTDFSESLLEFITPPLQSINELFANLLQIHQYSYSVLKDELLWALSMPCHLPPDDKIPIARYGNSNLGLLKYYYRVGLGHRYGKRMQMIAGVHYNFSFSLEFWKIWHTLSKENSLQAATSSLQSLSEQDFISESYLSIIRNALRFGWILPLLFGASPAITSGFVEPAILEKNEIGFQNLQEDSLFLPYATSLRLSDLGYHNKAKPLVEVSYHSFPEFIQSLHLAVHTKDPEFAKIGIKVNGEYRQLSDCVLQVEDEHYALLRPKRMTGPGVRMFPALAKEGIEYIEVRALDLNPFHPLGVEPTTVYFLDTFLIFCLLVESKPFTAEEKANIAINQQRVAKEGRKPGLKLKTADGDGEERLLLDLCYDMLKAMEAIADCLDKAYNSQEYSKAVRVASASLKDFGALPSAKILQEMQDKQESFCEFASRLSLLHQKSVFEFPFDKKDREYYATLAEQSLLEQKILEQNSENSGISFDEYLAKFLKA